MKIKAADIIKCFSREIFQYVFQSCVHLCLQGQSPNGIREGDSALEPAVTNFFSVVAASLVELLQLRDLFLENGHVLQNCF